MTNTISFCFGLLFALQTQHNIEKGN